MTVGSDTGQLYVSGLWDYSSCRLCSVALRPLLAALAAVATSKTVVSKARQRLALVAVLVHDDVPFESRGPR